MASARPGDTLVAEIEALNIGDTRWLSAPSPFGRYVTLGVKLFDARGRIVADTLGRTHLDADVVPGAQVRVQVRMTLPGSLPAGQHELMYDVLNEYVGWFSDVDPRSAVRRPLTLEPASGSH